MSLTAVYAHHAIFTSLKDSVNLALVCSLASAFFDSPGTIMSSLESLQDESIYGCLVEMVWSVTPRCCSAFVMLLQMDQMIAALTRHLLLLGEVFGWVFEKMLELFHWNEVLIFPLLSSKVWVLIREGKKNHICFNFGLILHVTLFTRGLSFFFFGHVRLERHTLFYYSFK